MIKTNYENVNLQCIMQQNELSNASCHRGVMSISPEDGSFRFEESVRRKYPNKNPKLYDGKYISLTHQHDGKYQCRMRNINATATQDHKALAFQVYEELLSALQIIN